MEASVHIPVLLAEAVAALGDVRGQLVADGTLGGGGHTRALLAAGANVVATDWDERAIAAAQAWAGEYTGHLELHHAPYNALPALLDERRPAGILLDLGFSSDQLDDPTRGLSYHHAGPLDMRLNSRLRTTAADVLNSWREAQLADLFYHLGEEPKARPLARAVVATRKAKPYATTTDFLATIEQLYPPRLGLKRAHPAARIFQALRVAVNDELTVLEQALQGCAQQLALGGTLAVITFQPNEERLVKQVFRALCADTLDSVGRVATVAAFQQGKKIMPSAAELALNPRARSAILRTLTRRTTNEIAHEIGLILTALMLSLLAFAGMMRIKTDVRTMDRERLRLVQERAQLRETKRVLEAEWALLASPERLQEIANQAGKTYFNGSALSQLSLVPPPVSPTISPTNAVSGSGTGIF